MDAPSWVTSLVSAVVEGITIAAVWAGIVWWWNRQRNRLLERDMSAALTPKTQVSFAAERGVGVKVGNPTNRPVTIRSVWFTAEGKMAGECQLAFDEENSDTGPQRDSRGWVELPPHTESRWYLPPDLRVPFEITFTGVRLRIAYDDLFGGTLVRDIEPVNPATRNHILEYTQWYYDKFHAEQCGGEPQGET